MEGFWIVQFVGMEGSGGGVVVLLHGRVYGGDSGMHYTGTYKAVGDELKADVTVHEFLPGTRNVLGITGDFQLVMTGTKRASAIEGTAKLLGQPGTGIAFKLQWISDIA